MLRFFGVAAIWASNIKHNCIKVNQGHQGQWKWFGSQVMWWHRWLKHPVVTPWAKSLHFFPGGWNPHKDILVVAKKLSLFHFYTKLNLCQVFQTRNHSKTSLIWVSSFLFFLMHGYYKIESIATVLLTHLAPVTFHCEINLPAIHFFKLTVFMIAFNLYPLCIWAVCHISQLKGGKHWDMVTMSSFQLSAFQNWCKVTKCKYTQLNDVWYKSEVWCILSNEHRQICEIWGWGPIEMHLINHSSSGSNKPLILWSQKVAYFHLSLLYPHKFTYTWITPDKFNRVC